MSRPLGRPLPWRQIPEKPGTSTASGAARATDGVASPASHRRISASRLDALDQALGDADSAVVLLLAELRVATGEQIARRLWSSRTPRDAQARAARRCLSRLESWRVIDRLEQRVGGVRGGSSSIIFALGPAGRRLLARRGYDGRRLAAPGDRFLAHSLSVTELVIRLHRADLDGELRLERIETEPQCWRGFLGLGAQRETLKPDLGLTLAAGIDTVHFMIEVDLASEAQATLLRKCRTYLDYYRSGEEQRRTGGVFPLVAWVVPDERRAARIHHVIARLPPAARALFRVWSFAEAVGRITSETRS